MSNDTPAYEDISSKSQLDAIMADDTPVVIDFWAPWCGPCKVMAPHFEAVAEEYGEEVGFYKINTQNHPQLGELFNVRSIPTVVFAHQGEIMDHSLGAMDTRRLKKRVEKFLSKVRGEGFFQRLFG